MGRNARRERGLSVRIAGYALLGTLALAWAAFAGVHHPARAALHGALAATLLIMVGWPDAVLGRAGRVVPVAKAAGVLLLAAGAALVPLPHALLAVVAPRVAEVRTGAWTLAIDPELAVGELCDLLLPLGALLAATAWGSAAYQRRGVGGALRAAFVVIGVVGAAHALTGATSLFGVVPSSVSAPARFFGPFIDPNHLGTALVLFLPAVLAVPLDERRRRSERIAWALVAGAGLALLVWIRSSGAVVAAAVSVLASARWIGGWPAPRVAALGGAGAVAVALWVALADPRAGATLPDRWATWSRALEVVPGYWLAGAGGGAFELAQQPLNGAFNGWAHAHQDYLEWLVEHGLVGLVGLGVAAALLRAEPSRSPKRAAVLTIGAVGVGVHALVDFPLQIPFLAMGAAVAWGLRRGAHESRTAVSPPMARALLGGFAALQLVAAGWEARTVAVERAVNAARAEIAAAPPADAAVWRLAPTRPERWMRAAWEAEQRGDVAGAQAVAARIVREHPAHVTALRYAAMVHARAGDWAAADAAFRMAERQFPGDWRTWATHALHAPPAEAPDRWVEAFDHGAPPRFLPTAYRVLPVGLVWLEVAQRRDAAFANHLGGLLVREGDQQTALLAYELGWMLDRHQAPSVGYVTLLLAEGRSDEARRIVSTALAARPNDLGLRIQEARLTDLDGEPGRASELYLAIAAERPEILVDAMRSREKADGARAALALLDRWELVRPAPGVVTLERARLHGDLGESARCAEAVERSGLTADPRLGARAREIELRCQRAPTNMASTP